MELMIYWFILHVVIYHLISVHNGLQKEEALQMKLLQGSKRRVVTFNLLHLRLIIWFLCDIVEMFRIV